MARAQVPALAERDRDHAEDQGPQRLEERPAPRPPARARVRPERLVQEGVRGGVRRVRRHPVRRPRRRLLLRQERPGHGAAREDLERRRGRARAVHVVRIARALQPREVHGPRPAPRPGEDLRHDRIREVEGVPAERGLALRRTRGAARPHARAVRKRHRSDRSVQLRGARRRDRPQRLPLGEWGLRAGSERQQGVRGLWLVRVHSWRGERRPRGRIAGSQLPHRGRRARDEVPDRGAGHRPTREGAGGSWLRRARAPEGYRERRVLQRPIVPEAESVRHAAGHRERAALGAAPVHLRHVTLRALPQSHDARQDRRLHIARADRLVPEPLDPELRHR